MSAATAPANNTPEIKNPTTEVQKMIDRFTSTGTLCLPPDYSAENALKSAWLTLQAVVDKDKRPALTVCTRESIINALLDMVVQGLNPQKKQCYFIVYGSALTCQRSYFGDQVLAERVQPGIEIFAAVVYEGDIFEYSMVRGRKVVTNHVQKLENQRPDKIAAAYCGVVDATGTELGTEIMTIEQIKKSWGMSKTYNGNSGPHANFPDQMCMRTVIRRRTKPIINASNDRLLLESVQRQDMDAIDGEIEEETKDKANGQIITLPAPPPSPTGPTGPTSPTAEATDEDPRDEEGADPY